MKNLKELQTTTQNTLMEALGMEYIVAKDDIVEVKMPIDNRTARPDGLLHGGASLALAETACGLLSMINCPEDKMMNSFGINMAANHIRQGRGKYVIARATFIHKGRRTHIMNIDVHDELGKLISTCRMTNMIVD